jgi:LuxR family maltose regulon positive regulatory protein
VVSAPAGYGKSTLLATWNPPVGSGVLVAHQKLRDQHASPQLFWAAAVQSIREGGLDVAAGPGAPGSDVVEHSVQTALVDAVIGHDGPVVWVLDCDEFTLSPEVGVGLQRLLEECAGALRLVVLTRSDPPLPLHRHRLAGTIAEIRAADLAFTVSEAAALMRRTGLDLGADDLDMLVRRTGGWPAGLRFAAMAVAGRLDTAQAIAEFRGDTGNVAAYLMSEVFARQPEAIRDLLLQTCVVDSLDADMVATLTGRHSDRAVLDFVAHGNSFVEAVPGAPGRYRYQPLFREFLRNQLAVARPALEPELHRVAASKLAGEGDTLEAIHHAIVAGNWSQASQILIRGLRFGGLLVGGEQVVLRSRFAQLPPDAAGAAVEVTRAALALADFDRSSCISHLDVARRWRQSDTTTSARELSLAIMVIEAVQSSIGRDPESALRSALAAQNALRLARAEGLAVPSDLDALVAGSRGRAHLLLGDLTQAEESFAEGVRTARAHGELGDLAADLQGMVALATALSGRLGRATALASPLLREGVVPGAPPGPASAASLALACVRLGEHDLVRAEELLASAEPSRPSFDARVLEGVRPLLQGQLLAAQGSADLALDVLAAARERPVTGGLGGWLADSLRREQAACLLRGAGAEQARALLEEGSGETLEDLLVWQRALWALGREDRALGPAPPGDLAEHALETQVEVWLVLAEQHLRDGEEEYAGAALDRALDLGAREHLRRPFRRTGEAVTAFVHRRAPVPRWLDGAATRVPEGHQGQSSPLVDPLTARELEVLGHLAELLTTEEIATAMFVSVNTVRTHVRNILRKLGAARRNEAVRRAWELGLLPATERRLPTGA